MTAHRLYGGGMSGQVDHDPVDLAPLVVMMAGDKALTIRQALPFEGRAESITTTLAGLRELLALAEKIEERR